MKTVIYTSSSFLDHDTGSAHPENAARIKTLIALFESDFNAIPLVDPTPADLETIALVHPYEYIYSIMDALPDQGIIGLNQSGDCILSPRSWNCLLKAAGAGIDAVDAIMAREIDRAFCAIRPPGHHATATQEMGFCFFNNAFIAARHAQTAHSLSKIAILDFDVHHGNGTDALVRDYNTRHPNHPLFYASTHQSPLWPMTGDPFNNTVTIINQSLDAGATGNDIIALYERHIFPALTTYAPELIILSAGFDAHKDDPLAGLLLESDDFERLTARIVKIANQCCQGHIVSLLEGGYNLPALKDSVRAHINALIC